MSTQAILDELFNSVAKNLKTAIIDFNQIFQEETNSLRRLAKELNINIPENIDKNKDLIIRNTERGVLLPVAEACVVAILRQLLKIADKNKFEPNHVQKKRFKKFVQRDALDDIRFKRAIGLENDEAAIAIDRTADVLLRTIGSFKSPTILSVSGNTYKIFRHQDGDGFIVQHLVAH